MLNQAEIFCFLIPILNLFYNYFQCQLRWCLRGMESVLQLHSLIQGCQIIWQLLVRRVVRFRHVILVSININIFRIGSEDVPNFIISELKNELNFSSCLFSFVSLRLRYLFFWNKWMNEMPVSVCRYFFFKLLHVVDSLIMRKYDLWLTSDCNMKWSLRSLCASMMRLKLHILRVVFF